MTLAQEGATTHVCCGCEREQSALAFRHSSPKEHGGWYDTEGVRRRPVCRTCFSVRARRYARSSAERSRGGQLVGRAYLPVGPFRDWILRKRGVYRCSHPPGGNRRDVGLSAYLGIHERRLWDIIEGKSHQVSFDIVDRALIHEGSTCLWELYPALYPDGPASAWPRREREVAA